MVIITQILDAVRSILIEDERIVTSDHFFSSGKRKARSRVYVIIHTNKRDLFVKYDQIAKSNAFEKEYQSLEKVSSNGFSIPQPIGLINKGIVMSTIKGTSLETIIKHDGLIKSIGVLNNAVIQMTMFHRKYAIQTKKSVVQKLNHSAIDDEIFSLAQIPLNEINLGFIHGDLDPFNTFFDSTSSSFGLIDWEDFSEFGIQELDALHFVAITGVIANPFISHQKLYDVVFGNHEPNPYLKLLQTYCRERPSSLKTILKLVPTYCDIQNDRLKKAKRNTDNFLYNEFKSIYNESKLDCHNDGY